MLLGGIEAPPVGNGIALEDQYERKGEAENGRENHQSSDDPDMDWFHCDTEEKVADLSRRETVSTGVMTDAMALL